MREFWRGFFGSVFGVLAAAAILVAGAGVLLAAVTATILSETEGADSIRSLPAAGLVLEIDLRGGALSEPGARDASAAQVVTALDRAGADPRVAGVVLYTGGAGTLHPARAEEIAGSLRRLSRTGKAVIGYVEDAEAGGLAAYLAVSGAAEVWASPLAGFAAAAPGPVFGPSIEAMLLTAAAARDLAPDAVRRRYQSGPFTAAAALEAGLVDSIGSVEAARIRAFDGAQATLIGFDAYLRAIGAERRPPTEQSIGLVRIDGPVRSGEASQSGQASMAAFAVTVADAMDAAIAADEVRAIVLRVDAPGGEPGGADQIADAVRRARRAGKPVVVSVAAEAVGWAYYAVAPADRIITPRAAILGGLGSADARLPASLTRRAAEPDGAPRNALEELRYGILIESVAAARDLPLARVDALGRGRLWSGDQAVERGLADEIGGLHEAVQAARSLSGMAGDEPAALVAYPEPPKRWARTLSRLSQALGEP